MEGSSCKPFQTPHTGMPHVCVRVCDMDIKLDQISPKELDGLKEEVQHSSSCL